MMSANVKRSGLWVGMLAICCAAACAKGAPAIVDADPAHPLEAPLPMVEQKCGNGIVDVGEMCDCQKGVTTNCKVLDKTCDMVMNGYTGTLLCKPASCTFALDICVGPGGLPVGGAGH